MADTEYPEQERVVLIDSGIVSDRPAGRAAEAFAPPVQMCAVCKQANGTNRACFSCWVTT